MDTDGHGFTGGNRANEEAESSGQKMRKSQKDGVRKMGAVTKFFDLRLLKVRLCADDRTFVRIAVEARRKAVTILGPFHRFATVPAWDSSTLGITGLNGKTAVCRILDW